MSGVSICGRKEMIENQRKALCAMFRPTNTSEVDLKSTAERTDNIKTETLNRIFYVKWKAPQNIDISLFPD